MATPSLKEVQDGGNISHNIIIYHIPCFAVILYFFVNFGSTSPFDDWNSNAVLAKCCQNMLRWVCPYMEVANRNACSNHTAYESSQ